MRLKQNESSQMDSQKEKGVGTAGGERSFKSETLMKMRTDGVAK